MPRELRKRAANSSMNPIVERRVTRRSNSAIIIDEKPQNNVPNKVAKTRKIATTTKNSKITNGSLKLINGHITDSETEEEEEEEDEKLAENVEKEDKNEEAEQYFEIDHEKEDDDSDQTILSTEDEEDDDDDDNNIADKIELIGDRLEFEEFNSRQTSAIADHVITSDEYFLAQCSKSKVSKQSFLSVLEKFDLHEADINAIIEREQRLLQQELQLNPCSDRELLKYFHLLRSDFNLLLYGFGSKKDILKRFAEQYLRDKYHYVVIHGYMETIKLKDVIIIMNRSIGNDLGSGLITNETELIGSMKDYFESNEADLFILIHSIDILYTKNVKIRNFLYNLFTAVPKLHLIASVDHINSALLWSVTEIAIFRWLWFRATTLESYRDERKYSSSQSSIFSTGSKSWKQSTNLLAVKQVYNSVNGNAQKIFHLILKMYLEARARTSAFAFYALYLTCREQFLVNSEVTLREHLAEFKYHNLIKITKAADGAESIQVTIDKDTVKRFIEAIQENEQ